MHQNNIFQWKNLAARTRIGSKNSIQKAQNYGKHGKSVDIEARNIT